MLILKKNLIILSLLTTSITCHAAQNGVTIPKDSPLTIKQGTIMPNLEFEGILTMQAKYQVDCHQRCPTITLYPSPDSLEKIPYIVRNDKANKASTLWIRNDLKAALELIGREKLGEILNKKQKSISGEALISIGSFMATYECDKPSYGATLLSVEKKINPPSYKAIKKHSTTEC